MLSGCLHLLHSTRAHSHGHPRLLKSPSHAVNGTLVGPQGRSQSRIATSLSRPSVSTCLHQSSLHTSHGNSTTRNYAKGVDRFDSDRPVSAEKAEKAAKLAKHRRDNLSLNDIFGAGIKVGETVIVRGAELEEDEWELDPMPSDIKTDLAERRKADQELYDRFEATEDEFNTAMGLSTARPGDRKATLKPARTVALQKLREQGITDLQDLADLDYEGLKAFALENEIEMSDFFTRSKTPEGEIAELKIPLDGVPWEDAEEVEDGPIERSKAYLMTARHNPKNFRDRIRVRCTAGSGGKGGVSFYRDTRVHKGPPDGGDGGNGGSVIFIAASNKKPSLASLKPSYRAHSGNAGAGGRRTGKSGADVVIEVPLGTTITEFRSKQKDEFADEEDNRDPSVADTFIPKSTKHAKKRDSAISAPSLDYEMPSEEELENMSDAARLDTIEQAHRARFADPREGRPWAEPELPESHPLKESAMQFHKMMESYTDSSGQDAIPKPVFSFDNQLVQGSSDMNIVAPGMEEYYDPEEVAFEDSLSGAELMEKYRLQPPSGREDGVLASNAPRTVELDEAGAYFVAAKGGNGGLGNFRLGAVRNRPQAVGTPGKPGESLMYQLELKLIADVGLVGFPNAGKSTFLSNVSRANPKIASYPFTTLSPEIGTVQLEDFSQFTIADLPGLIEGAHANKGLGHQFLKHIERTTALIYLIDMSGGDNRDPWKSFLTLWDELERYQPGLAKKDAIIVANKMDSGKVAQDNLADFSKRLKAEKEFRKLKIYPVSAASKMNLIPVISALTSLLGLTKPKPTSAQRFSQALRKNNSGVVTMRIGSHFSEAMRNVK